jgi:hypothetical protein
MEIYTSTDTIKRLNIFTCISVSPARKYSLPSGPAGSATKAHQLIAALVLRLIKDFLQNFHGCGKRPQYDKNSESGYDGRKPEY